MYHYKARVCSPTLGRFLQTDPVGYQDQVNLSYTANGLNQYSAIGSITPTYDTRGNLTGDGNSFIHPSNAQSRRSKNPACIVGY